MALIPAHIIHLRGADAVTFANAQFASDLGTLQPDHWQWSAWLDARGRVRAILQWVRAGEALLGVLRGDDAGRVVDALRRYVLRLHVELTTIDAGVLVAGPALPMGHAAHGRDGLRLGYGERSLCVAKAATGDGAADGWSAEIEAGCPWLPDAAVGTLLPPALGLYRLGAVSISKGCYPGQEIAARLHFRGGAKQRLCRYRVASGLWHPGLPLTIGDETVGVVLACAADMALAAVRETASNNAALPPLLQVYAP